MTNDEIIRIGTLMGLGFDEKSNYKDMLQRNIVVFDGCNGQRFLIEGSWTDDEILEKFGDSLIVYGKRLKSLEVSRVLSINCD